MGDLNQPGETPGGNPRPWAERAEAVILVLREAALEGNAFLPRLTAEAKEGFGTKTEVVEWRQLLKYAFDGPGETPHIRPLASEQDNAEGGQPTLLLEQVQGRRDEVSKYLNGLHARKGVENAAP